MPYKPLTTIGYNENDNKGASFETDWNSLRITIHQFMKGTKHPELMIQSAPLYVEAFKVVDAENISDVMKSLKKKEIWDWDRKSTTSDDLQILLDHGHQSKVSLVKMLSKIAMENAGELSKEIVYAVVFITDMMAIRASKKKTECHGLIPTQIGIEIFLAVLKSII